jgi:predicted dehydrogenase
LRAARRGDLPEPDFIVLATPTSTHLDLASHVLVETASTVLSEKPLTGNSQTLREFETCHADASERVHVVNHFAFSPEVEWAARFVAERAWFTPSMVLSTFNDPYVKKSEVERATYVSSWIDSGPNQIGLLARFVSGGEIRLHTSTSDGMRSITEMAYVGGSAVSSSNWHTGDSSKQTSLRWANGREILLDHTRR